MDECLGQIAEADPQVRADLRLANHYPLMYVDTGTSIVTAAHEAIKEAAGSAGGKSAVGPDNEKRSHTPHEHVGIALLKRACRIWMRVIVRVFGVASGQSGNFPPTVVPYKPE